MYEVNGVEHGRYHHAVRNILGYWQGIALAIFQSLNMVLTAIAYTISAAESVKNIARIACDWDNNTDCPIDKQWIAAIMFGGVQLVLSQVPSLEEAWGVSALGTISSLLYSGIALGLGIKYAGAHQGTIGGIPKSTAGKVFGVLSSLGAMAFAFSFAVVLLEVQDTLRQPPKASKTMKKSSLTSISGAFGFYFTVAIANYSAFGNDVPSFIFNAYSGPQWVVCLGYICVMLHMVSAFQVFAQPMFDTFESWVKAYTQRRRHDIEGAAVVTNPVADPEPKEDKAVVVDSPADLPGAKTVEKRAGSGAALARPSGRLQRMSSSAVQSINRLSASSAMYRVSTGFAREDVPTNADHVLIPLWQRLIVRSLYVVIVTVIACIMPFFGDMAGLVGAITFFPLSVYFPIRCWSRIYKPRGAFNGLLWVITVVMGIVAVLATIASFRQIITAWSTYKLFA